MIRCGVFITFSAITLALAAGCGGTDDGETGSSSGGGGGSSSGGSSSGGSSSGGSSSGSTSSSSSSSGTSSPTEPEKKDNGGQCEKSADCKSDFCVFSGGGSLGMCTETCDDDIDCDLGQKCVRLNDAPQKVCVPE